MAEVRTSFCRVCHAMCGLIVHVENGRVVKTEGDPDNPLYEGYACPKGRQIPELMNGPNRLLRSLKRVGDRHVEIPTSQALDEIADRLRTLIDAHGSRSVAIFSGGYTQIYAAQFGFNLALKKALGQAMIFTNATIDQPGKPIATALMGRWEAGRPAFHDSDVWMLVGTNPIVSQWGGIPANNPAKQLKQALDRGMRLIVIDPRRSETAAKAAIHLQPRPGEDPAILAGMIRVIIEEGLHDSAFVAENVAGLDVLRDAVAPFTPEHVAERAGIPADQLVAAARLFATGKGGSVTAGTGPNMSPHGTLTEYLVLALNSLCGRWLREGDRLPNPYVMLPRPAPHAQARAGGKAFGFGAPMRGSGLHESVAGPPVAGLLDEILLEGEGQVKALLAIACNPVVAWPDQAKVIEAFGALDLSVAMDITLSATARLSDYVIASKTLLEVPGVTKGNEEAVAWQMGYERPYAMHTPAIVDAPPGSDMIEPWEFAYGIAQRLGLQLVVERTPIDMANKPSSEDIMALTASRGRVPLEEIKRHPHGAIFEEDIRVLPKEPGHTARLDVAHPAMMEELAAVFAEYRADAGGDAAFPYRLVSRRMMHVFNSTGRQVPWLMRRKGYNPAFLNPNDAAKEGVGADDIIAIDSEHGTILGVVQLAADLRPGVISMSHGFGDISLEDDKVRLIGSPTGRLISVDRAVDPISGIPRMSAVPVRIRLVERWNDEAADTPKASAAVISQQPARKAAAAALNARRGT